MQKNKLVLIVVFVFLAVIIIAAVLLMRGKNSNQLTASDEQIDVSQQPPLPAGEIREPYVYYPQQLTSHENYTFSKLDVYSYELLSNNPDITVSARSIKGDFGIDELGVSLPAVKTYLKSGKEILILSGCHPHNCGGTRTIISYDENEKKSYLLVEKVGSVKGYELFGNPPEEIEYLLIHYFFHQ